MTPWGIPLNVKGRLVNWPIIFPWASRPPCQSTVCLRTALDEQKTYLNRRSCFNLTTLRQTEEKRSELITSPVLRRGI